MLDPANSRTEESRSQIIEIEQTRMTTSIISKARRNQTSILIRGRENPDGQTDIRTDIIIYRVASLLKT